MQDRTGKPSALNGGGARVSTTQKPDSEALRAARTELQAFKWSTLEAVNADPLFDKSATCHKVMHVALQFLNVDTETLERTEVFLPHALVMAKTCLCKNSVKKAKALLCKAGYLVPRGRMQNGIEVYVIRNPRKDLVGAHVDETLAYLKQEEAERRSEDRRRASLKRMSNNAVGSRNDTTEMGGGVTECRRRLQRLAAQVESQGLEARTKRGEEPWPLAIAR